MANRRNHGMKGSKADSGRDAGGFAAIPWSVLDCPAYARLSHPARSLLMEIARQFVRDNNGRLLASAAYLGKRGWTSNDTITKAKRELMKEGFIFRTVQGHRPNKADWFAVTWRQLDKLTGYDMGTEQLFKRGAYLQGTPLKNASLTPSRGVEGSPIAPSRGVGKVLSTPSGGAIKTGFDARSTPSGGDHLDMPSVGVEKLHVPAVSNRIGQLLRRVSHRHNPHHMTAVARLNVTQPV